MKNSKSGKKLPVDTKAISAAFTLFIVSAIYMLVARERKPVVSLEKEPEFAVAESPVLA